jgi:hypothetical protein
MCSARSAQCIYVDNHAAASPSIRPPISDSSVHDRILHLERLVMSAMRNSIHHPSGTDIQSEPATLQASAAVEDVPHESEELRMDASEHQYVGADHWRAIMKKFASLKDHLGIGEQSEPSYTHRWQNTGEEQLGIDTMEPHALLLFGLHRRASKADILSSLPPRNIVDRYIARYFNYQELVSCSYIPTFNTMNDG